ncbi:MBL fold metallo-hydrolase [Sporosarcina gallistercoris]|uniref:MBL fold metallo-hydrolase n=1 Tax=Sporosarcina gallistercoris TaxID=2762245 RepID=UPI003D29C52B
MKVTILGGGSEVGASCVHVQIGETALLIDAGMRMHGDDLLPALGLLEELAAPDAILVTHAHADHIGALPIVHSLYPTIPIYATPPTIDLMRIMMKDAFKIMEQRSRLTNTLPPYTMQQVTALLDQLLVYPASGVLRIGDATITSYRAGHILGAVMYLIEADGERLLITGDISFKAGRTIPGVAVPRDIQPDVVIMESTYGNRAHTDRNTEEKRLAEHVAEVVTAGGFALIPAFALGRAQEVLLVLQDYMDKGLIPEFPIYVDGLVTPISGIYKRYPHYLKGPVAHRIRQNGDAFLTEGRCKAVTPQERETILTGKPGCIVASSGMLTGGASAWYAERLVGGEKNAIFITGYQDEESPGRKLLALADGESHTLELNGTAYEVKCRIGKYGLSAHADANEMDRFIRTLEPTYTMLVHGDDEARQRLSEVLDFRYKPILVENGETYPFDKRTSGKGVKGKRYTPVDSHAHLKSKVGQVVLYQKETGGVWKFAICTGIHPKTNTLHCQTFKGKSLQLQMNEVTEFLGNWNGPIDELKQAAQDVTAFSRPFVERLNWNLAEIGNHSFDQLVEILGVSDMEDRIALAISLQGTPEENRSRSEGTTFYKLTEETKRKLKELDLPIQGLRMNQMAAMETVRALFSEEPRFLRCGVQGLGTQEETIVVSFDFPDVVTDEEREVYRTRTKQESGWDLEYSNSVRQDLLQQTVSTLFGTNMGVPSIHLQNRLVTLAGTAPKDSKERCEQFQETTGFRLQFKGAPAVDLQPSKEVFNVDGEGKRMENNEAIEEAKRWASKRSITLYKVGVRQDTLELHFVSPEVAKRHEADMEELSWKTGRPVTFTKNPKQNEIIRIAVEAIPADWQLVKNPSIHIDRVTVSVKLADPVDSAQFADADAYVFERTGYRLEQK